MVLLWLILSAWNLDEIKEKQTVDRLPNYNLFTTKTEGQR
jgi:hypothetical protein